MTQKLVVFDRPIPLNDMAEIWVQEYRQKPYLRTITDAELQARTEDIVSNLMVLGRDGKYRPKFALKDGYYFPIRNLDFPKMATHVWEERRHRWRPTLKREASAKNVQLANRLANQPWCARLDWVERSRLSDFEYERPRMLFRFSEAQFNCRLLERGEVYFRPASGYKDPSLNNAVADDELVRTWYSTHGVLTKYRVDDYYCACFAAVYDRRLFFDFREQDFSCVAISDVAEFIARIRSALKEHNRRNPLQQIAELRCAPVIYYDPFFTEAMATDAEGYFCKHFRYAYQQEYRLVLVPKSRGNLSAFSLEIGDLRDIAEMISESSDPDGLNPVTSAG